VAWTRLSFPPRQPDLVTPEGAFSRRLWADLHDVLATGLTPTPARSDRVRRYSSRQRPTAGCTQRSPERKRVYRAAPGGQTPNHRPNPLRRDPGHGGYDHPPGRRPAPRRTGRLCDGRRTKSSDELVRGGSRAGSSTFPAAPPATIIVASTKEYE